MSDSGDRRPRRDDRDGRPSRPAGSGGSGRPQRDSRPQRDGDSRPRRDGDSRPQRDARPQGDGERRGFAGGTKSQRGGRSDRAGATDEKRLWTKGGAPARGDRSASEREVPEDRDPFNTRSVRAHHDAPVIPDDVKDSDLDRVARNELKTLEKENAEGVARHLVMAARLIDDDPELAHQHAISAARRAGRIGVVRETLAITAYATGDFALALRELRTFRRITGRDDHLPMMVDSERGVGRPEKALELARSVPRASLPVPVQVELAIAMSGARLDLGQTEAALNELQIAQLDPTKAFSYSPALFESYGAVLEELGRESEAGEWYARADAAAEAIEAALNPDGEDTVEVFEEEIEIDLGDSDLEVPDVALASEGATEAVEKTEDETP